MTKADDPSRHASPQRRPLDAAATEHKEELLGTYARAIAHEAGNLLFLEQILAKGPVGHAAKLSPESAPRGLPPEFRRSLNFIYKQARLLAGSLVNADKARTTTGAELAAAWEETLAHLGGLGVRLKIDFDAKARAARFRERTGMAELLLQHVSLEIAREAREAPGTPEIIVTGRGEEFGLVLTLARADFAALPQRTSLTQDILERGPFRELEMDVGRQQIAFVLPGSEET